MSGIQKKITLDPNYLALSGSRKKTRKERSKKIMNPQPSINKNSKTLRKKLIEKIRNYQNKQDELKTETTEELTDNDDSLNSEFNTSVEFLKSLSDKKEKRERKKKSSKNLRQSSNMNQDIKISTSPFTDQESSDASSIEKPSEISDKKPSEFSQQTVPEKQDAPASLDDKKIHPSPLHATTMKHKQPEYSCLKGGSRPTYREWKKKTQKNIDDNNENIHIKISIPDDNPLKTTTQQSERSKALEKIKQDFIEQSEHTAPKKVKKKCVAHRKIRTVKYKLGKSGKGVAVLVKNTDTRRKIKHEISLLKKKAITEVKQYLRDKNLLKVGSDAPNDVLRQMYEQSILSGEVQNKSDENLMHNFMSDNK